MDPKALISVIAIVVVGLATFAFFSSSSAGPTLHTVKYRKFKLVKKTVVSPNTAIYRFALPRDSDTLGLPIGQHVSVQAIIDGNEVVRSYTPVSTNSDLGYFDLLIKSYPQGKLSNYVAHLKIGDTINVRGPKGLFTYKPNMVKRIGMVAGGSGITPMYQVLQAIASNPEDMTEVSLVFANVNEVDIFLREELEALAASRPGQIRVHYVLNNPPAEWTGSEGFVTAEILKRELPAASEDAKLLMCGPLPMVSAIKKASQELGWAKASMKSDSQVFAF